MKHIDDNTPIAQLNVKQLMELIASIQQPVEPKLTIEDVKDEESYTLKQVEEILNITGKTFKRHIPVLKACTKAKIETTVDNITGDTRYTGKGIKEYHKYRFKKV